MRDRILPIDVLFARASEGGAPFELLRDESASGDGAEGPADAELAEWEVRSDGDAVERDGWDDDEDLADADADADDDGDDDGDADDFAPDELERSPLAGIAPLPEAELSFAQHQVYGEARAYGAALVRHLPWIRRIAQRIAGDDVHFEGDLAQEALIELWEIDASRFDEDDQMYLKQVLARRMIDAAERDFMQERLVPRARARAYVRLRKEIGPSIQFLGPHRPMTFSDSEEE